MIIRLPHLVRDIDRHGNIRIYVRKIGHPKVRIRAAENTPAFLREYEQALTAKPNTKVAIAKSLPGTLHWLCGEYYKSVEFSQLGESTIRVRRLILERICRSTTRKGVERGTLPFTRLEDRHVREIRDESADRPEAANGNLKALRQLFRWACSAGIAYSNPAISVDRLSSSSEGFHTWTDDEVKQFEDRHPIGTKARLAFALLRYTGVRRSDVVKLGPHMEREGDLQFLITKGSKKKGRPGQPAPGPKRLSLPILPQLREILNATACGKHTYLTTDLGRSFTAAGFGNKFRAWCDEAGLPQCSAHGIRKYDATFAAENGATEHELMAMFGWDSPKQAAVYTRRVNRSKLARGAMHRLADKQQG